MVASRALVALLALDTWRCLLQTMSDCSTPYFPGSPLSSNTTSDLFNWRRSAIPQPKLATIAFDNALLQLATNWLVSLVRTVSQCHSTTALQQRGGMDGKFYPAVSSLALSWNMGANAPD